jgi:hypothetical protein
MGNQLAIHALVEWVSGDQALELGNELGVAPVREICLEPILVRRQPRLLEPARCVLRERFVPQIGERLTAPELERLTKILKAGRRWPAGLLSRHGTRSARFARAL